MHVEEESWNFSKLLKTSVGMDAGANLDEGKSLQLEEENLQLQTAVQELSLQNEHIRKVVGMFSTWGLPWACMWNWETYGN